MNFLSHYYLHRNNDNNFTVGLTVPDLLGFHSARVRVTEYFLKQAYLTHKDISLKASIEGMLIHLRVDRWFHNSAFFRDKQIFLKDNYKKITGSVDIPHHICHILLEILLDRHLLMRDPALGDDFYSSYKKFNFEKLALIFSDLTNFNKDKFISLARDVSNSHFLNEYLDFNQIYSILERVSRRIGIPLKLNPSRDHIVEFFKDSFDLLEKDNTDLFIEAGENISVKISE
jgi:hypothetical protein